ncbi:hypothetical protein MUK42_10280 [Musa troglodytarum]|uniref:Uncharacterized protein n=1 Tax=Musa troglodytarum TaxID=320322 RepID=A0A9E7E8E9_9LILI|nr:hypothetical protein MUK42_10280 [Musa troglodytarum]
MGRAHGRWGPSKQGNGSTTALDLLALIARPILGPIRPMNGSFSSFIPNPSTVLKPKPLSTRFSSCFCHHHHQHDLMLVVGTVCCLDHILQLFGDVNSENSSRLVGPTNETNHLI